MKTSRMMQNRTKRWMERILKIALFIFLYGVISVYKESFHQRLSEELRQEQIRAKELINEASNLEWKLAEHASTSSIKKAAMLELGMVPNGKPVEDIFIASAFEEPPFGIMSFFKLSGKN